MSPFVPDAGIRVRNQSARLARATFACSGQSLWEVWVPSSGEVVAPPFPPARLEVRASFVDDRTRVAYTCTAAELPSASAVQARWQRHEGANCFSLVACHEPEGPEFVFYNTAPGPVALTVWFAASPYVLRAVVRARAVQRIAHQAMELTIVQEGVSAVRSLTAGAQAWDVVEPPGSARGPVMHPSACGV